MMTSLRFKYKTVVNTHLPRMLFLLLVSSGKFLPVSHIQKAGTARHSRQRKAMSVIWVTPLLMVVGNTVCRTNRLKVIVMDIKLIQLKSLSASVLSVEKLFRTVQLELDE